MEDARFEWLRERVYHGLKLDDAQIFEKLLEDDKNDDLIRKFILDTATDETAYAILFYVDHVEKVRDIEVEYEVEVTDDEEENEETDNQRFLFFIYCIDINRL